MFQPTKEWVNKVNLSSFELENFFKFVLAWLAREKQNILTSQPCLHTVMQTRLSARPIRVRVLSELFYKLQENIEGYWTPVFKLRLKVSFGVWLLRFSKTPEHWSSKAVFAIAFLAAVNIITTTSKEATQRHKKRIEIHQSQTSVS